MGTSFFTVEQVSEAIEGEMVWLTTAGPAKLNSAMLALKIVANDQSGIVLDIWDLEPEEPIGLRSEDGAVTFLLLAPGRRLRLEHSYSPWYTEERPLGLPQFPDWKLVEAHNLLLTPARKRDFSYQVGRPNDTPPYTPRTHSELGY